MANEITVTGSLTGFKSTVMSAAVARARTALQYTMTGTTYIEGILSVLTSATLIPLGGVTSPHWAFFYNSDPTNFVKIMNGSGGAAVVRLYPDEFAIFPWDIAATPYAIADTAICLLEYLIFAR